ncbi:MAG: hypothetical protein ABI233_00615 [Chthoniobacterales bacterium]
MESEQMGGDIAERGISYAKDQWGEIMGQTEDFVRANPTKALGYGVAAGFLLDRLPIFRILGVLIRIMLMALKPAVLVFGATKIYQMMQNREE